MHGPVQSETCLVRLSVFAHPHPATLQLAVGEICTFLDVNAYGVVDDVEEGAFDFRACVGTRGTSDWRSEGDGFSGIYEMNVLYLGAFRPVAGVGKFDGGSAVL